MLYYERKLQKKGYKIIIGVDEAGRGPLAGPVVAAAVRLNQNRFRNRIDDSKKLSPCLRSRAFKEIIRKCDFAVAVVNQDIIDRINILEATRVAMQQAIFSLVAKISPTNSRAIHVIIDGNMQLEIPFSQTPIIKGDSRSKSIAAASILAKVSRDNIMDAYDKEFPGYGFCQHKGYPTEQHRKVLKRLGPSLIHRKSFCCV